ncbi:unnamed protein product [Mycena citricolor]|uniref:Uncharacterized protein n=1 Tax=Mycena citricolor TaxID=2018698 RepID=A0AAD2K378_9AGAR|nr:unnamed protein product [Mycena citricolor]
MRRQKLGHVWTEQAGWRALPSVPDTRRKTPRLPFPLPFDIMDLNNPLRQNQSGSCTTGPSNGYVANLAFTREPAGRREASHYCAGLDHPQNRDS